MSSPFEDTKKKDPKPDNNPTSSPLKDINEKNHHEPNSKALVES